MVVEEEVQVTLVLWVPPDQEVAVKVKVQSVDLPLELLV
jgi:hypothetical protein